MSAVRKRKICVVTGTRAEYGLLFWLLKELKKDKAFTLQLVVTGAHLSKAFGFTYKAIQKDGFRIDAKVPMPLGDDSAVGIGTAIGKGTIGFSKAFRKLKPDLVVLLGDRYETLAAAQAALVALIPVAHIAGGDSTEGAFDEAIRHSITKMSHLHFVTNDDSARRVRQLGENPKHVFNVGSPGIDQIKKTKLLSRAELEAVLGFRFRARNILVTYHPETLAQQPPEKVLNEFLKALDTLSENTGIIVTMPNADPGNRRIRAALKKYAAKRRHVKCFESLGQQRYLSAMSHVDAVVGNSSSGILEAPSFRKPTVNIGDRQKGRLQAGSVINCPAETGAIVDALQRAFALDCSSVVNPYGDGTASEQIVRTLKSVPDFRALLRKAFFDLPNRHE
jgi:UDP-N-acetylglucosamine 2-epimerase (non-hydrolysing)/GDP/UDP-N,N'-diacetylbacillosamine 2-epimerase (hydrolysing)